MNAWASTSEKEATARVQQNPLKNSQLIESRVSTRHPKTGRCKHGSDQIVGKSAEKEGPARWKASRRKELPAK